MVVFCWCIYVVGCQPLNRLYDKSCGRVLLGVWCWWGPNCGLVRPPNSPVLHLLPCPRPDSHWNCCDCNIVVESWGFGEIMGPSIAFVCNLISYKLHICNFWWFYIWPSFAFVFLLVHIISSSLFAFVGVGSAGWMSEECGKQKEEAKTCLCIIESHSHPPKLPTNFYLISIFKTPKSPLLDLSTWYKLNFWDFFMKSLFQVVT